MPPPIQPATPGQKPAQAKARPLRQSQWPRDPDCHHAATKYHWPTCPAHRRCQRRQPARQNRPLHKAHNRPARQPATPKCRRQGNRPLPKNVATQIAGDLPVRPAGILWNRAINLAIGLFRHRHQHCGDGLCRQTFAATGKAQSFGCGGLDRYGGDGQAQKLGQPLAHGLSVRLNFRCLANQCHINMGQARPCFICQ